MKKILIAAAAVSVSGLAFAAAAPMAAPAPAMNPWYVGVGINHYSGFTVDGTNSGLYDDLKDSDIGFNLFGGYRVSKHLGGEVGYSYVGERKYGTSAGLKRKVENDWNIYLDGMAYLPFNQYFELFAKGGVNYISLDDKTISATKTSNLRAFGMNIGAGAQVNINQFGIRATYTHNQLLSDHQKDTYMVPDLVGLDVLYHFG